MLDKEILKQIYKSKGASKNFEDICSAIGINNSTSLGSLSPFGKSFLVKLYCDLRKNDSKIVFLSSKIDSFSRFFYDLNIDDLQIVSISEDLDFDKKFFISDFKNIFRGVIAPDEFDKNKIRIKTGDKLGLSFLSKKLTDLGYERNDHADDDGQFKIKGDTINIFFNNTSFSISLFGDVVEDIFSLKNKKKDKLDTLEIKPLTISDGDGFLIEYFSSATFFVDNENELQSYLFSMLDYSEVENDQKMIGRIKLLESFLKKQKIIYLEDFSVADGTKNLNWISPKKYYGNTTDFLKDLKKEQSSLSNKNLEKIFIVSEKAEQISSFIKNNDLGLVSSENLEIKQGTLCEGLKFSDLGITLFSDKEIFGEVRKRGSKKRKIDFSVLTNLKKGECVVHIDHGVGVFTGFGEIVVDKIRREYIFIEYAGGDSIYVPIDQADKITKYIAVGNSSPHLSSLKTNQWLRIRKKVSENAEKVAKELLELQALRSKKKGFTYLDDSKEQKTLERNFKYNETPDQKKSIEEVLNDMLESKPMDRILCGDVGYGKTEVAVRASLRVAMSGGQVVVLVPTTILAEQHLQTFRSRLDDFGVKVESLSRFRSSKEQKEIIKKVERGEVDIVIGTHRLFSDDIKFKNLHLIIIDEEQKFGVKHKEKLKKLRSNCDILTMTATPIPRTLYQGLAGLRDISLINTPPEGRLAIKTVVMKSDDEMVKEIIEKEVKRGGQVYFVHNRVETIMALKSKLEHLMPKIRFVFGHGQMGDEELAKVMNDFASGEYDVLICSTIIESGLDISTVNTLIVNKATNFGLSQLHQLRGRIGRGNVQAYAYFLYDNEDLKGNAKKRLSAISEKAELGSGYELSLEDLDIRGGGNILGLEQHGSMQMVGVGYYLKLLEEAIEKQRLSEDNDGSEQIENSDIKIDLPISAFIPDGFYEKEEDKIRAYQILAGIDALDELEEFEKKLNEKYKNVPLEIINLIGIVRVRLLARKAGVSSILTKDILDINDQKVKKIFINFNHILDKEEVGKVFNINRAWYFGNTLIKIDLNDLGNDWFIKIIKVLESLEK